MRQPVEPSRSFAHPRFRYVPAVATDIRKTFAKFRRLIALQQRRQG